MSTTRCGRVQANVRGWRAALGRTVRQAIDEGHLRPDTDPEQLVFEIYSLMVGLMHDARFLRDPRKRMSAYGKPTRA